MIKFFYTLLLAAGLSFVHAQSISPVVLASAGESGQGANFSVDWTVGELVTTLMTTSMVQVTQGFHQPNEFITKAEELPQSFGQIEVFPNPTADWLTLELHFEQHQTVHIQLAHLNGQEVWGGTLSGTAIQEELALHQLPTGSYLLTFSFDQTPFTKTYKILKNQ